MIYSFEQNSPDTSKMAFIAPSASIIGKVYVGAYTSVWFNATVRGDFSSITIGDYSNIQDNCVIHVSKDLPVTIGSNVSVGHAAIVHSATIGTNSIIGMGSIIIDGSSIGDNCIVAAGSVVPPGKTFPAGHMIMGTPAKATRKLTEQEIEHIQKNAHAYYDLAVRSKLEFSPID